MFKKAIRFVLIQSYGSQGYELLTSASDNYSRNIEQAIHYLEMAAHLAKEDHEKLWAQTQLNLSLAYVYRVKGETADNIEQAIECCHAALKIFVGKNLLNELANTHNTLGNLYRKRIIGKKNDNLDEAMKHYNLALRIYTPERYLQDWAMVQANLGNTYADNSAHFENREFPIEYYRNALSVWTKQNNPLKWANVHHNIASAYNTWTQNSYGNYSEQAIRHGNLALEVYERSRYPHDWAMVQNVLGAAYLSAALLNKTNLEISDLHTAIEHFQSAQEIHTREEFPNENLGILTNLVHLYLVFHRWEAGYQTCLEAIAVGNDIFDFSFNDTARLNIIEKTSSLFVRAAYCAIQMDEHSKALTQLEAGKARLLAEAQALGNANLRYLNSEERQELQQLREKVKGLDFESRLPLEHPIRRDDRSISTELRVARAALKNMIATLRNKYLDFMPEGLNVNDILSLIPSDGALVAPLFTTQGSAIFIIPNDIEKVSSEHIVHLDDFTVYDLEKITRGETGKLGWLEHYNNYLSNNHNTKLLIHGIDDITYRLWDAFVGQIHKCLQTYDVKNIIVLPQGDINLLPIHIARGNIDSKKCYLVDKYTITYAPSMTSLANSHRNSQTNNKRNSLVVGVSQYKTRKDLPNTQLEIERIASFLKTKPFINEEATVDLVEQVVREKTYVHLSCHGGFGWEGQPFTSALYLHNDEALTLPVIMAKLDLTTTRLVVLSACETGIVDVDRIPDEFLGLPAAFMQAGAMAVVSSLWSVDDRSTSLLMEQMYRNMLDDDHPMEPAQALREAQLWLRDATSTEISEYYTSWIIEGASEIEAFQASLDIMMRAEPDEKPYSHPYYWAAFTYNGI